MGLMCDITRVYIEDSFKKDKIMKDGSGDIKVWVNNLKMHVLSQDMEKNRPFNSLDVTSPSFQRMFINLLRSSWDGNF